MDTPEAAVNVEKEVERRRGILAGAAPSRSRFLVNRLPDRASDTSTVAECRPT
jgi:hypothetical protein